MEQVEVDAEVDTEMESEDINETSTSSVKSSGAALRTAYKDYLENGNEDELYTCVFEFAKKRLYYIETRFKNVGTSETVDDWAQESVVAMWEKLRSDKPEVEDVVKYLAGVCRNMKRHAYRYVIKAQTRKVPLEVEMEAGESGSFYLEDNPEIYKNQPRETYRFQIPDSIQGIDRNICLQVLDGKDYKNVARCLNGMTESAVKNRMEKLRHKLLPMVNAKSKIKENAELRLKCKQEQREKERIERERWNVEWETKNA